MELRLDGFRTLVDALYEADTYAGPSTFVTDAERRWIVEEALARIDDPTHPLYTEDDPAVGLIEQAEELLTLLEFADAITADEVKQRLTREEVPELGRALSQFVRLVHEARRDGLGDAKTFRSERFRHVLNAGQQLVEVELAATDVVVIGSFQTISPLERDVVGLLADTFDTGVVVPRVTDSEEPNGVDAAVRRICDWYEDLGFESTATGEHSGASTLRETAAASLYRHASGGDEPVAVGSGVSVETHATVQREVRAVAREVRSLIGEGVDPEAIAVAPFDAETYGDRLTDVLRDADVPVSFRSSQSFFATSTGKLFEAVMDLGTEPDRQAPLVRLLSNPLVYPGQRGSTRRVLRTAELLESARVSVLTDHVEATDENLVRDAVAACDQFVTNGDFDAARQELFAALGIPTSNDGPSLTDGVEFSRHVTAREQQAIEAAADVCASLTDLRPSSRRAVDADTTVETLRRALEQVSIDTTIGRESNSVRVCSPVEAVGNDTDHVIVPGLTTEHTPSPPRRLAFARPLNDAHSDFEAADPVAGTRYAFAQLLASDATVTFTAPERDANGDPYVIADTVLELERVTELEVEHGDNNRAGPATYADVHRSLATAIDTDAVTPREAGANADTYDIDVPGANAPKRLASGVQVAAARAVDTVGEYDGHVDPEVVADLRDDGQPYSPSRLETFADCGFKYYLGNVLDIESDDEVTLEPDALDIGTYVHDVLERFYREWRAAGNENVSEDTLADAETKLYAVAAERLAELDARETAFHDAWLAALFDGLDVPDNRYGDPDAAAGLFKRFLRAEVELAPRDVTPTYFEAHVGLTPDEPGPEVISDDPVRIPGTDVEIRGKIDRLDITSDGGLVGIDYKTGSTNNESDTVDGHAFQLPAYLLMAEEALDGEPVGASYYQVTPTSSISPHDGTIGGDEDAAHAYWGTDDPDPLRRYRSLAFDTRNEFNEFLHETVPDRIDRISTAVDDGSFHPTVLDPGTAGCEYCPYRDACDVRHHRRHAVHQHLTDTNTPHYAPGLDTEDTK
ncbi:MAG: PD-(D/E)XK nuclease family protein [Halorubrum sp.]|uniref:PD-(D/E)XK nuclease family protein n=1 Tax=Halorubrum sp. TaxID=1879286 RepID=UPI0039708E5D